VNLAGYDVPQKYLYIGACCAGTALLYRLVRRAKNVKKDYPPNTVILHMTPRGHHAPSYSPFPIKLETYLRIAKIPYKPDFSSPFSPKGKTPWISYNGVDVSDSQFCIEYLNKIFNKDICSHLSTDNKAFARAYLILIENSLYWCLAIWRWRHVPGQSKVQRAVAGNRFVLWMIQREVAKQAHGQGMGRHSMEELMHIAELEFRSLSSFLGTKKFLMGDQPSEVDCSMFGMLATIYWHDTDFPMRKLMMGELDNLASYCERMKAEFWPDWNDCITVKQRED